MKKRTKLFLVFLIITCLLSLTACNDQKEVAQYNSYADLDGETFAVLTGSIFDKEVEENFPNSEILFCNSIGDTISTILEGKAEATVVDNVVVERICSENDELTYFDDAISTFDYAGIFPKDENGQTNAANFNLFLQELKNSGQLSKLQHKWFDDDCDELFDYAALPNTNGTLSVAVDTSFYPFVFVSNNQITALK